MESPQGTVPRSGSPDNPSLTGITRDLEQPFIQHKQRGRYTNSSNTRPNRTSAAREGDTKHSGTVVTGFRNGVVGEGM